MQDYKGVPASPSGCQPSASASLRESSQSGIPNAALSAWAERRPPLDASQRHDLAEKLASHLPELKAAVYSSANYDDDLRAMKAAFIKRFNEDLPRTETLMAVANIGYRMALRDLKAEPAIRLAYGLLWHMRIDREDDNLRLASDARKALLSLLSKDEQADGIARAKATDSRFTGAT